MNFISLPSIIYLILIFYSLIQRVKSINRSLILYKSTKNIKILWVELLWVLITSLVIYFFIMQIIKVDVQSIQK